MAVKLQWDTPEQKALRYTFTGQWTWHDFMEAAQQADAYLNSIDFIPDVVLDMSRSKVAHSGLLYQLRQILNHHPAAYGLYALIDPDGSTKKVRQMFRRIYRTLGVRLLHAESLEAARALLAQPEANYLRELAQTTVENKDDAPQLHRARYKAMLNPMRERMEMFDSAGFVQS